MLRKIIIIAIGGLLVFAAWSFQFRSVTLYEESFEGGIFTGQVVKDGSELVLKTESKGEGEWNKSIALEPGKISWEWNGEDLGDFQLWLRLSFNNYKSIYYVADGSMNPPYEGEYFMDEEGRRRFSPAAMISGIALGKVERDIREDYKSCCGSVDGLKIIGIAVGMADDSTMHKNEMRIYNIKIFG
jgi:hypothetical protein